MCELEPMRVSSEQNHTIHYNLHSIVFTEPYSEHPVGIRVRLGP